MLQPRENAKNFRFYVQLVFGQFGHLIKNLFSYPESQETKRSEKERCTFRGVLDSVHFHRMREEAIQLLHVQEKHLADIVINSQSYLSKVD
jgi:hypothetical protein